MATQAEVQELLELLKHAQITTYVDFASLSVLVYDYVLTIETEKSLIWTMPWSLAKVLFIATRYLPFIDTPLVIWHQLGLGLTNSQCEAAYRITGWLETFGILLAEIILVLRAWAIWERRRVVGIMLGAWTLAIWVPQIVFMAEFLSSLKFSPFPDGIRGCLIVGGSSILTVNWILLMVYEAGKSDNSSDGVLLAMLVIGFRTYQLHGNSLLFKAVYGDGSLFYLYLFGLSVANVIIIQTLPADFLNTLTSIERVLHSVLACRILINLRRIGRQTIVESRLHTQGHELNTLPIDFRGREAYISQGLSSATFTEQN